MEVKNGAFSCPYQVFAAFGAWSTYSLGAIVYRLVDTIEIIGRLGVMLGHFCTILIIGAGRMQSWSATRHELVSLRQD